MKSHRPEFVSLVMGVVCGMSLMYAVMVLEKFKATEIIQTKASGKWICVKQATTKEERK